jgi:hypothetical protein
VSACVRARDPKTKRGHPGKRHGDSEDQARSPYLERFPTGSDRLSRLVEAPGG